MLKHQVGRIWERLFRSKLLTQSGLYFVGQLFQKGTSFLLIPVWTYYLIPADYGIVGAMSAYSNLLHILLMLGIYGAVVRHFYDFKAGSEAQKSYVFSNFLFLSASSGAILVGLSIFGDRWWNVISSGSIPFRPFATVTLMTVWGALISRLLLTLYQTQQRAAAYITIEGIAFVISVVLGLIFVAGYRMGAYGQILGGFIAQVIVTLIAVILLVRDWFTPRLAWHHVWNALIFGLPLVPHLLSGWALTFVDRVMLEHFVPLRDVGFYNLGYNLGMGMLVLVTSINQAYQPYYYGLMSSAPEPNNKILRVTSFYVAVLGLVTLASSLFAGELIAVLTPEKYRNAAVFVPPILLSYLLVGLYYFVGSPLFYFKKTTLLPIITGSAAILNILLNYFLIPRYGAIAAAWTTLASYGVMLAIYYIVAQRINPLSYPLWRYAILLGILFAAVIFVSPTFDISIARFLLKLTACGFFATLAYILVVKPRRASTVRTH
jgi:O-antigen/teichoic acid export membrane protein